MNPQPQPPRRRSGRGGRIGSNDECLTASRRRLPGSCGAAAPGRRTRADDRSPEPLLCGSGRCGARSLGSSARSPGNPAASAARTPSPSGRRWREAPDEGVRGRPGLHRSSAWRTLTWRFAPVLSRFAGEGIRAGLGAALAGSPGNPVASAARTPSPSGRRWREAPDEGVRGRPGLHRSSAWRTLTWRFAPVFSRFAGEGSALAWELRWPERPEIRLQALEKARFAPENGMASGSASPRDASGLRRGEDLPGASRPFPGREPMDHQLPDRRAPKDAGRRTQAIFASRARNAQPLEKAQFMDGSCFPWRSFCFPLASLLVPLASLLLPLEVPLLPLA